MKQETFAKAIQAFSARLARLEKTVFGKEEKPMRSSSAQDFRGPSGGVRLLVSRGFFKTKRKLGEVRKALAKHDYHYGAAQVQTALNRLSTRARPLAAAREGGKKCYVKRK